MKNNNTISAYDYVKNAYLDYGREINLSNYQRGRHFCDVYDGLKLVYRHCIQALYEQPNQMIKVNAVLGDMMKKYHFHGIDGTEEVIYSLQNDYKMAEVQGNSGSRTMTSSMPGAANRYTEARLKPQIREQLQKLLPFVPEEKTVSGYAEKRYIPTPIPLSMIAGTGVSMGVGMRTNLPAFTAESLYNAYIKNDPKLLRLNYGYSLGNCFDNKSIFDINTDKIIGTDLSKQKPSKENEEALKSLWENGECKITIGIPMYLSNVNGQDGFMLVCDPNLTIPEKSKQIVEWEMQGLVEVFDYSDEIGKMFFSLTPRTKKINLSDLQKEIYNNCKIFQQVKYTMNIATETRAGKVALYDWINFTHDNYTKLYEKYIQNELNKLDKEEIIWYNFRAVVDYLIDKKKDYTDKEIVQLINDKLQKGTAKDKKHLITIEHVEAISNKSFNTFRTTKPEDKLKQVDEERKKIKSISIEDEIKSFIDCFK